MSDKTVTLLRLALLRGTKGSRDSVPRVVQKARSNSNVLNGSSSLPRANSSPPRRRRRRPRDCPRSPVRRAKRRERASSKQITTRTRMLTTTSTSRATRISPPILRLSQDDRRRGVSRRAQNRSLRFMAGLAWSPVFSRLLACGISRRPDRPGVRDNN